MARIAAIVIALETGKSAAHDASRSTLFRMIPSATPSERSRSRVAPVATISDRIRLQSTTRRARSAERRTVVASVIGPWLTASNERMFERLRNALELVLEAPLSAVAGLCPQGTMDGSYLSF